MSRPRATLASVAWAGACALGIGCGSVTPPARPIHAGDAARVHVHVASPVAATLVATDARGLRATVCDSPCDATIDTVGRTFVLDARGHASSPELQIPPSGRGVVLRYEPSEIGQTLGIGLFVVPGAAAAAMGATLILLDQSGREDFAGTTPAGAIIAGSGAALVVSGILVWALVGSDVSIEEATKRAARGLSLDW